LQGLFFVVIYNDDKSRWTFEMTKYNKVITDFDKNSVLVDTSCIES